MYTRDIFSKDWAVFLAECCQLAYDQYHQNGIFSIPEGFNLVKEFKGVSFHSLEWFGFILESEDAIIVSFRGTQTDPDWISDAEIFQQPFPYCDSGNQLLVHGGFLSVYESMREELLTCFQQELSASKTLFITGHSLGGALAALFSLDCAVNTNFSSLYMYSFGAPRVGNEAFANLYNEYVPGSIRFVNLADLVPFVPPTKVVAPISKRTWHYKHTMTPSRFLLTEGSIIKNHSIETYIKAMREKF
ncbi:lipase family protein [Sutcliffiella horikoshii]|uniref:Lipase family protein n=1 Tax=Sutcliffiella horikoshii TaxID=79883 RepID=A0A5D4T815_9BACI|nr:lipase family protein [Sutcliffiella horikoshii]TYS71419.1 lipase family protein [Sutcliffiella horikoshii]